MTSPARYWSAETEREFLDGLRTQYVDEGYTFITYPSRDSLPDFLGSYRPDAIAQQQGANVAIEVKHRPTPAAERSLKEIRRIFEGHPEWQLVVTYIGSDPLKTLTIPTSSASEIRLRAKEVFSLSENGNRRAAFVMAWSLLEAALHRVDSEKARPLTPGTVVQTLAMRGYIDAVFERRLRTLIELRNLIVHGDLSAEPSGDDVRSVLSAVEQALDEASAPS